MKSAPIILSISVFLLSIIACEPAHQDGSENTVSTAVIDVPASATDKMAEPGSAPEMVFNQEKHDFGKIFQGEKVSYSFVFKNTGGSDLVISSAQGSCGCTVPSYPKGPVKPGQQSTVDVVFNSEGKSGMVEKTVTLVTNCNPSTKVITIAASILESEKK
jgi:Protein of unknown function (DUF1573)